MSTAVPLIFYGSLAALALWATWRDRELVWIGFWLVGGFLISNVLFFLATLEWRPGPYSVIEVMVFFAAMMAWAEERRLRWPLLILCGVNVLSIAATVAFAATIAPNRSQIFLWELTTNICFAVECLLATWVGVADGYRTGRFARVPRSDGRVVAPDAAREDGS